MVWHMKQLRELLTILEFKFAINLGLSYNGYYIWLLPSMI